MSLAQPVRETKGIMVARAEYATRQAEEESLPSRRQIYIDAAATWMRLASRKVNLAP